MSQPRRPCSTTCSHSLLGLAAIRPPIFAMYAHTLLLDLKCNHSLTPRLQRLDAELQLSKLVPGYKPLSLPSPIGAWVEGGTDSPMAQAVRATDGGGAGGGGGGGGASAEGITPALVPVMASVSSGTPGTPA
jgi:hypothetical protein